MFSYLTTYFDDPPVAGRAIDVWMPKTNCQPVALYFVHGGGWRNGHREQMHRIMLPFYQRGYPCVSVCYRLGGATIASQLSDVREGLDLARRQLAGHGFTGSLVLYGSSAGGHLALLAGLAPVGACGDSFCGETPPLAGLIASCAPVSFEPWDDIFPPIWDSMQQAAGAPYAEAPSLYRRLSPAAYAHASSLPVFFLLGECEHMFPNSQTVALVEKLQAEGKRASYRIYPNAEHGFFYTLERSSQKAAFKDALAFLESVAAPSA